MALVETFFEAGAPGTLASQALLLAACLGLVPLGLLALRDGFRWAMETRTEARWLALLLAVALGLRIGLPTGPMDIHYRLAPSAIGVDQARSVYGMGFPTVVRLVWSVTGISDQVVFAMNTVLGVVLVGGLYAVARRLGFTPAGAGVAGAVTAVSPALSHFSRTDNQTTLEIVLTLWALHALIRHNGHRDGLTAALAIGLAATMRPEAVVIGLLAPTAMWAMGRAPQRSDGWLLLGLAIALPTAAATLGLALEGHGTQSFRGPKAFAMGASHPLFLDPAWTPVWATAGLFLVPFASGFPVRLRTWVVGWLFLLTWLVYGFTPDYGHLAAIRHQLRAIPFLALAAGIGLQPVIPAVRRRLVLSGLVVAGLTVPSWALVTRPPTMLLEYNLVLDRVGEVPSGCAVLAHFNPTGRDVGLIPPTRLSAQGGYSHHWVDLDKTPIPTRGCAVYYRGSNCYATAPGKPLRSGLDPKCQSTEAALVLEPLATQTLPGRRFGTDNYPPGAELELGFFSIAGMTNRPPLWASVPAQPTRPVWLSGRFGSSRPLDAGRVLTRPQIDQVPEANAPDGWPSDAIEARLRSDPSCPPGLVDCERGVCIVASSGPDCSRDTCAAQASGGLEIDTMRFTWEEEYNGRMGVACALLPADDPDGKVVARSTARAQQMLFDLLNPELAP